MIRGMGQEVGNGRLRPAISGVWLSSGSRAEKQHLVFDIIPLMKRYLDFLFADLVVIQWNKSHFCSPCRFSKQPSITETIILDLSTILTVHLNLTQR